MVLSPDKQARFALCALKSGIPVGLRQGKRVTVIASLEFTDFAAFTSGFSEVYLCCSAEKYVFHTEIPSDFGVKVKILPGAVPDLDTILKNSKKVIQISENESLPIVIAKQAETSPEVLLAEVETENELLCEALHGIQILDYSAVSYGLSNQKIVRISESVLHLGSDKESRIVCYRAMLKEHYAIIIGRPKPANTLVRLHSSCYTGDLLGSLSCDCRDQLHEAMARMQEDPDGGVILYLMQDGRGIGLPNKIKAYDHQSKGMDTVEANLALGFKDDEREFSLAKQILDDLDISAVRLLTNNPRKIEQLSRSGINIVSRVPITVRSNRHNVRYLQTKSERLGHILGA